jgi:biotin carboxyl carrier protein
MKLDVRINGKKPQSVDFSSESNVLGVSSANVLFEAVEKGRNHFTVVVNQKSIDVFVLSFEKEQKKALLLVNGKKCTLTATDEMDVLLQQLGMDAAGSKKIAELKAPMPGLVVKVDVTTGEAVKKDQPLLILEAMKMENVLKAQADGVIQSIEIKAGQAVEKNQVLIKFK